ncbi:DUF5610 domain-containing protein [Methylobacillus flagellatus]|uniref:DUF5610 domain-containing protein n=1 Tax=Methylobacillus flagellatus (strain ATCC 51484 / DSM 6875 / VKM B-1610 / KT) TaxID=265072 RepID=Q1H101_METFK|nr:DUF5610 domain-containing protein [Methylobacillus flagellatus]ABE49836.1 conserved hypothetical protein [Methylobacillus flagellatus KT]
MVAPSNNIANSTAGPANEALSEAKKAAEARPDGQKTMLNAKILQASLKVSIQSGNDGLALLYRSAIEHINAVLEPQLGANAIGNAMAGDHSAEATAGRILSMSTGFFDAYAARHPDQDPEEVVRDFVALIRGGFEKGYAEAKDILAGLGVLGEGSDIAADIANTYALVQKGYDDFLEAKQSAIREDVGQSSQE